MFFRLSAQRRKRWTTVEIMNCRVQGSYFVTKGGEADPKIGTKSGISGISLPSSFVVPSGFLRLLFSDFGPTLLGVIKSVPENIQNPSRPDSPIIPKIDDRLNRETGCDALLVIIPNPVDLIIHVLSLFGEILPFVAIASRLLRVTTSRWSSLWSPPFHLPPHHTRALNMRDRTTDKLFRVDSWRCRSRIFVFTYAYAFRCVAFRLRVTPQRGATRKVEEDMRPNTLEYSNIGRTFRFSNSYFGVAQRSNLIESQFTMRSRCPRLRSLSRRRSMHFVSRMSEVTFLEVGLLSQEARETMRDATATMEIRSKWKPPDGWFFEEMRDEKLFSSVALDNALRGRSIHNAPRPEAKPYVRHKRQDLNILLLVNSAIQPDLSKASLKFFQMRCQDPLFFSAISEKGTMSKEQDFIKPPARPAFTSFIFSFYPPPVVFHLAGAPLEPTKHHRIPYSEARA
ncbi:hypothetical protein EAG_00815 [Camponotus floridanus]|uniref:Uncharacterized protein n=1 Tax=Camponotus floridanus TaxID=104421 RepID=E2AQ51_CAMFO|nr:hypothetical protein EAG_00815 [Camponotus floridanus]